MKTFELKSTSDDNTFEFTVYDDEKSIYENEQVIFKVLCHAKEVQTTKIDKYNHNPIPYRVVNGSVEFLS